MPISQHIRFCIIALLIVGGLSALLVRLFAIQVQRYEEYAAKVPGTSEVKVRIPGVRGLIRDRFGRVLVDNVSRYEMQFNLKEILDSYKEKMESDNKRLAAINRTGEQKVALRKMPFHVFQFQSAGGIPQRRKEKDMVAITSEMVFPRLEQIGLFKEFHAGDLQRHWRTHGGLVPYTYRDDLSFNEYAIAAEHSLDLPGVSVEARPLRRYVYKSLASHILGFVRQPDIKKVPAEERRQWEYYVPDDFGGDGIEDTMNRYLQGKPGKRVILKNEKGRVVDSKDESGRGIGEISYAAPKPGADVWLSIDLRYQFIAERALRKVGRGTAVVIAPTTYKTLVAVGGLQEEHWIYAGDILAMASVPSYDPNKFIPSISEVDWKRYLENDANPLINRALKDHAPGSTFKIPVALAGMLNGADNAPFKCDGGMQFGKKFMKCWVHSKGYTHGRIFMRDAIKYSCNGYFYRYGNKTGIRNIQQVAKWMGLGERSGIPLNNEDPGLVPNPEWKLAQGLGKWGDSDTAQVSIGQGATEVTPLQMAAVAAGVANRGICYKPKLVHKIVENGIERRRDPVFRFDLSQRIPAGKIEDCRRGMWEVVNADRGTAGRARSELTQISGKTGTAQTGRKREGGENETNAWFISFAPYAQPKLAVCIMVENAKSGGGVAAPIAKKIIDEILSIEKLGIDPKVAPLREFEGKLDFVAHVGFDDSPNEAFVGEDDGDDGSAVAATPTPDPGSFLKKILPAPTIRKAPDSRGSAKSRKVKQRIRILDRLGGRQ
ncbi:MAG: penicillin-binding transpeptidase domain-containing protein [Verrucomicrobiales bacterium]